MSGLVSLVGAGPGDPGLITVLGARRLREAEVVIYDRLANARLLALAPADALMISAAKQPDNRELTQEEINAALVEHGRDGRRVVRLKGGDPYVFGRGGEEALALRRAGINFEVVPGISSAVAAPAYAGIPVTHRGLASSFAVVTGHEDPTKPESAVDWRSLAQGPDTLVVLMGLRTLPWVSEQLIAGGRDPQTPVALVRWGTLPEQTVITATLVEIAERAAEAALESPVVAVIGDVVELREHLAWFENRPLFGKTVLVTRARQQASELVRLLEQEGAEVVELPAIEIHPAADATEVDRALASLVGGDYAWTVFTSANGVDLFWGHLQSAGRDTRAFAWTKIAAIGPGTADALAARGLVADLTPTEYVAEGLAAALVEQGVGSRRVLLPRAEGARRELIDCLEAAGASVDEVTLYRAAQASSPSGVALERVRNGDIDVATFASSSTVRNLVSLLGDVACLDGTLVASIGPVTSTTAKELGLRVDVEASEHTIPGLVDALRGHFARKEAPVNA
jgi:uroporphyrinogen III methyltransferase / synthase